MLASWRAIRRAVLCLRRSSTAGSTAGGLGPSGCPGSSRPAVQTHEDVHGSCKQVPAHACVLLAVICCDLTKALLSLIAYSRLAAGDHMSTTHSVLVNTEAHLHT